jgi:hypothetical protein
MHVCVGMDMKKAVAATEICGTFRRVSHLIEMQLDCVRWL